MKLSELDQNQDLQDLLTILTPEEAETVNGGRRRRRRRDDPPGHQ